MVLVLDDLHAADRPSLLLLQFIARQLYDASILVIGTYRELEARRHSEVAQVLGDLVRDGHRISLTGLNERDIARFVENAMRRPPSDTLIAGLHEVTEGNPFFLDEIVRLWMSERTPGDKPERLKIPSSVREAIGRRLSPMSEEGRRALRSRP